MLQPTAGICLVRGLANFQPDENDIKKLRFLNFVKLFLELNQPGYC
jgi:hypothetical protein